MFISSTIASTIAATVLKPVMYLAAPSLTPKITGLFASSQAAKIAFVHSKLLMLKCPTAYPSFLAFTSMSFAGTNTMLFVLLK